VSLICGTHGEWRGVYRTLVGRPEGKRPLGRPRHRWEDNIKMDLRGIGIDGTNRTRLGQNRVQWLAFANTVMNRRKSTPTFSLQQLLMTVHSFS
jgi:hypothetical protein